VTGFGYTQPAAAALSGTFGLCWRHVPFQPNRLEPASWGQPRRLQGRRNAFAVATSPFRHQL